MTLVEVPLVGRIWVVLGGFLPSADASLPPGAAPKLVPKLVLGVSGDGGTVVCPPALDGGVAVEGELALIIGRRVHGPTADEAAAAILGFTCFNDATALGPLADGEWSVSKSLDTFASLGPTVRTDLTDEEVMAGLAITTRVNGEERQRGDTRLYKFPPAEVVRHLATHITLLPGDVVSLGTPPPPAPVVPGDEVEIEVEGVGLLRNRVA